MKKLFKNIFFLAMLISVLASCKKEENKVFFEGGTAPVLTASSTAALTLPSSSPTNFAIKFNWTNPNYQFSTGVSSQDVNYTLQVDTTGSNFTNPNKQEVAISKSLDVTYTVKELNTILTKLMMQEDINHNIEFRIKSTLGNSTVPMYSNVVKIVIKPYLDVAIPISNTLQLYITGDATAEGWTNSPSSAQKMTKISNTEYSFTMSMAPGKYYKFLTTPGFWQPQYGLKIGSGGTASSGELGLNNQTPQYPSDPDAIPTPSTAGTYKINVNFKTGKYTVTQ